MTTDSYNDIGQLLKRARQERRLDLEEISQALHIRAKYLEALETGQLSELPGLSYTKGYLQSFATYVGLDRDEILQRFEDVEEQLGSRRGFYFPQVFRKDKTPSGSLIWGGLGGALLLYVFWLAVLQPHRHDISLVEQFPKKAENSANSANDACLKPDPALYPPCTMAINPVSRQAAQDLLGQDPALVQSTPQD